MKEITKELIKMMINDFKPVAEDMAKSGATADDIIKAFNAHMKIKQNQYYKQNDRMESIKEILIRTFRGLENKISKAELIFYNILEINNIDFKYQYKIGSYSADFLFKDNFVLEIDGPDHKKEKDDKRDKYFKQMGYKTLRVPLNILFHSPQAVIDVIQKELSEKEEK